METRQTESPHSDSQLLIIKARCPSCFKLYAVDAAEIHEAKPQFACVKCQTQFWFPFPESIEQKEVLGFPVEWLQTKEKEPVVAAAPSEVVAAKAEAKTAAIPEAVMEVRLFSCPRCQAQYSGGDPECPKCGVIFAKLNILDEERSMASSPSLRRLWHQVMDNYSNRESHRRFILAAQRENNLLFASYQYKRLLQAHSGDETALKMQQEIMALTEVVQGVTVPPAQFRPLKLMPRLTTVILLCGGGIITLGFMIEAARNMIGLGVAMVFFTLAARWLLDR